MNSHKNKLNSKIILIFNPNPNAHVILGMFQVNDDIRAFPSGVSNAKYLAFGTPNTKKLLISGVLNAKIFGMNEQYNLKNESVWTEMVKNLLLFFSLFSLLSHHFILFSLLSHQSLPQTFLSTYLSSFVLSLFFLFSCCFSLFLSALPAPPP